MCCMAAGENLLFPTSSACLGLVSTKLENLTEGRWGCEINHFSHCLSELTYVSPIVSTSWWGHKCNEECLNSSSWVRSEATWCCNEWWCFPKGLTGSMSRHKPVSKCWRAGWDLWEQAGVLAHPWETSGAAQDKGQGYLALGLSFLWWRSWQCSA